PVLSSTEAVGRRLADGCNEPAPGRSAHPRFSDDSRNLLTDQPLDDIGKVFVEPRLQHRAQHAANDLLERTFSTTERQFSLAASIARQGTKLSKGGGRCSGGGGRDDALANRIERRLALGISLRIDVCGRDRRRRQVGDYR